MQAVPEHIIIKTLQQTASPEEERELNYWLQEDRQNVETYCRLQEIWNARNVLTDEAISQKWNQLYNRMNIKTRHTVPIWMRYAAAVCLSILVTFTATWLGMQKEAGDRIEVIQNRIFNQNGIQKIVLPDNSVAWLNENTRISYPETFGGDKRQVSIEGKVFFEVRKNTAQPFIVQTGNMEIQVTGTSFFVQDDVKTATASVTLVSGGVTVQMKDETGQMLSVARLQPGQQASVDKQSRQFSVANVDTSYYLAWKDGTYRFTDEPLEKIAEQLALHYGMKINIVPGLKQKRFTGRITPEHKLKDVMEIISKSHPVKYRIENETIYIREK
ncbi:MAG: FecR domain-containing protein [Tannerella sp.]|jgi:ferric-dicitrate binding protein FerR (iron transport regulator)|nr:FecR domain-containing protein [Tannerella sp.]